MAFLLKMDRGNPPIHFYFIFFIQKISMGKSDNFFQHNSNFSHLSVYNIGLEYVLWNDSKNIREVSGN